MSIFRELLDSDATSIVIETVYEPAAGSGVAIAPALYVNGPVGFDDAARPVADEGGFHTVADAKDRVSGVTISSTQGEASRMESALWENILHRGDIDVTPALVLTLPDEDIVDAAVNDALEAGRAKSGNTQWDRVVPQVKAVLAGLDKRQSSWNVSHRHADAVFRFAEYNGEPVSKNEELNRLMSSTDPADLVRISPTSLIHGFWLSHGSVAGNRRARLTQSSITGYGISEVLVDATKIGEASAGSEALYDVKDDGSLTEKAKGGKKPSELGFGHNILPEKSRVKHYICDLILGRTSISLSELRHIRVEGDAEATALIQEYLLSVAVLGRYLADADTFIRSSTDLVPVEERCGVRIRGERGVRPVHGLFDDIQSASDTARNALADRKLINGPTYLTATKPYLKMIASGNFPKKNATDN